MLNKIKILLGIADTSKDELLQILIDNAISEATSYTYNDNIADMVNCICNMVVYNFNRIGTEGLSSESYNNVEFSYTSDYPENIMRQLKAHRKLRVF